MLCSDIRIHGGVPTLFSDGAPMPGPAYVTYLPEREDYAAFAAMGHKLYSVCVYFSSRPVNAHELCGPFMPGLYEKKGEPDFSIADREIERVLAACPDALIFPRINVNLPRWWDEEHPEACNDTGIGDHPARPCPASPVWQETCKEFLRQLIRHLEDGPYADRILGYQIAGGQTEEWMAIDMNGNQGPALREAFAKAYPDENDPVKFREFAGEANAAAIISLTRLAKEEVRGRKVVGVFYGYTFEMPWWQSAHSAMGTLIREASVDFFCSPFSYNHLRRPGMDLACMTVLDSVKLHGKLYFVEADIRTCQTLPLPDSRPGICEKPNYTGGVWAGPEDPQVNAWQLRLAFGRMLTHGHALWWFDMWGGWYDHPLLREEMARYPGLAARSVQDPDRQSVSELAVFIDEKACARSGYPAAGDPVRMIAYENRIPLGYAGVPYDVYDVRDFDAVHTRYKAAVFLIPWATEAMADVVDAWRASDRPFIISDSDHPDLTPAEISALCREAGCHLYAAPGDVLYASAHWVLLHAAFAGEKTVRLPGGRLVTDCISGERRVTDTLTFTAAEYETRLFRLD